MPTRFPTPEDIEAKRSALLKKIAIGKRAEQDLEKLEQSIKALAALVEFGGEDFQEMLNAPLPPLPELTQAPASRPKRVFSPLAEFAEAAIRKYGKLHIDELMKKMAELGWLSAADYKLDSKNVFNSLSANKKFTNLGMNQWDLTENVKKNEENHK